MHTASTLQHKDVSAALFSTGNRYCGLDCAQNEAPGDLAAWKKAWMVALAVWSIQPLMRDSGTPDEAMAGATEQALICACTGGPRGVLPCSWAIVIP